MFFFFGKSASRFLASRYSLFDKFTTDRAAGAVNGTAAEPVGGTRTVTDTNNKISIAGGVLSFATNSANGDGVWYPSQARALGKTIIGDVTPFTSGALSLGWDSDQFGSIREGLLFSGGGLFAVSAAISKAAGVYITSTTYSIATTLRASGSFVFIKGGTFSKWTLLYINSAEIGDVYPAIISKFSTAVFTADNIRVPKRLYIPIPLQSDGFSAITTDGAGNAEANGAVGNAYTNVGTWGVASGVRSCSALSGGLGFSYLPCQSSNVIIDAKVTRSAGVAGIVARYASATDYLIAYHDGTNAKLDKVVSGVTTNLVSAAATYSAGAVLRLILDGTNARLFYNNAAVGTVATTPAAGSLNHGLYTTDTGNTFDDLIIWARGNEGQYNGLDSL